ncbi:Sterol 3-beta-glucosyltransferase UGT80B1 [Penicillium diatomitis]|uniref:Sterol 3-beta-glucosyltransferase UGT80B1 n=1 Tax=Penicillium diatomitis TaxID=2819901 RepID=A0A9W9WTI0_9EURO|nr:Sterol 3-beta-glucosyltransferase UGT80B1 [Penicillium diatomitis]KAJ5475205.1 Sterol 3-beta-glucosyltransferase UGT80B1 [Penicillium diatomitis]
MPSVAPAAGRASPPPDDQIESQDWPTELKDASSPRSSGERMHFKGDGLNTGVRVMVMHTGDGRLKIRINQHKPHIAGLLNLHRPSKTHRTAEGEAERVDETSQKLNEDADDFPLHLNIVIQVVGSRGDVQPFVALGKELQKHGHRVRLATHLAFREFVLDGGLEFFNIGGDPAELMAFMVKNSGLLPNMSTIRSGAIQKRRREMRDIVDGCWRSCFEMGDGTNLHQIKEDLWSEEEDYRQRPFVADVIIANPPSLAHIHCAQKLGIPLHIIFTWVLVSGQCDRQINRTGTDFCTFSSMPWSPTQAFPHPLAVIQQQDCKPSVANFVSYAIVDMMIWEGLGDIVNKYRRTVLTLGSLDAITAPSILHKLRVPCSYLWSPAILPKPEDWGDNIDVCGFSFLPSKPDYDPPKEITEFLNKGPMPIYVGFGSIVVDDQKKLTETVYEAVKKSGQRAIISKGWGNVGVDSVEVPDNILVIGSCPHDWLFRQVSCVIHHGGAGTTAAGLALGCPTIIVPFFGDQQFWGDIVARNGAGPSPIPHKQLTVDGLSDAIRFALKDSTREKAMEIAKKMEGESGVRDGVRSFHRQLDLRSLRCAICPSRPAVWHLKHTTVGLSAFAAAILVETGKVDPENLVLNRPKEYDTYRDPVGPISASAQVLFGAIAHFVGGIADAPADMVNDLAVARQALINNSGRTDLDHEWRRHRSRSRPRSTGASHKSRKSHDRRKSHGTEASDETRNGDEAHTADDSERDTGRRSSEAHNRSSEPPRPSTSNNTVEHKPMQPNGDAHGDDDSESSTDDSDLPDSLDVEPNLDLARECTNELHKTTTVASEYQPSRSHNIMYEIASFGGKMSLKFVNLLIWLPTDLTISLSKGFHNAPKLWHDPMVRSTPKVDDIQSGFRAAGQVSQTWKSTEMTQSNKILTNTQELFHGFYDGVTGLVTQPRHGYKQKGTKGMIKGIGKGLGGVFCKPPAGMSETFHPIISTSTQDEVLLIRLTSKLSGLWGITGYPLMGVRRRILAALGRSSEGQIVLSRIAQGHEEMYASSPHERAEVVKKWSVIEGSLTSTQSRRHKDTGFRRHFHHHHNHYRGPSSMSHAVTTST